MSQCQRSGEREGERERQKVRILSDGTRLLYPPIEQAIYHKDQTRPDQTNHYEDTTRLATGYDNDNRHARFQCTFEFGPAGEFTIGVRKSRIPL